MGHGLQVLAVGSISDNFIIGHIGLKSSPLLPEAPLRGGSGGEGREKAPRKGALYGVSLPERYPRYGWTYRSWLRLWGLAWAPETRPSMAKMVTTEEPP